MIRIIPFDIGRTYVVNQASPFELDFPGSLSYLLFDPTLAGLLSAGLINAISPLFPAAFDGAFEQLRLIRATLIF